MMVLGAIVSWAILLSATLVFVIVAFLAVPLIVLAMFLVLGYDITKRFAFTFCEHLVVLLDEALI